MSDEHVEMRRLLSLAKPHWKALSVATLALFAGSGLTLLYPQAARIGIDDVMAAEGSVFDWQTLGFALIALFVLQAVFVSLRYYLFTIIGERVVTDLRKRLFDAIVEQEIGFFDGTKTGELTSRLTSDTQILQNAVTVNVSMALRNLIQAIGGIAVLFFTSFDLALVMVVAIPAVVGIAVYYGRKVRKLSRRVQDMLAESTSIAEEGIAGIRTVRSFAAEDATRRRYDGAVEESFEAARHRTVIGAIFGGVVTLLGYGAIAVILWFGGAMVMEGTMSAGELTAFLLYTFMVAFALGALSGLWTDFMKASGSAERVFQLIDRLPELDDRQAREHHEISGKVVFDGVTFAYPTRPEVDALRDVSFAIEPGQKVALVGPSGAGKSTVGALILRFYDPALGAVRLDGNDLRTFDPDYLREQIGVVAQEPVLFSGTVSENVSFARPGASLEDIRGALEAANALSFVEDFPDGLDTVIGERGVRLSGGQKQRIAIARALLKNPRLLVLDEATSALDVESESLVQQALERLMEDRTTLIIAHRLSTVAGADLVVVLDGGLVVEKGPHRQLVEEQGLYHRLIESQRLLA